MHTSLRLRSAGLVVTACATLVAATACTEPAASAATGTTFDGPTVSVGNGTARSYVTTAADGTPAATGIRMTATALDGLTHAADVPMQVFDLALPQDAPATVFDHLTVDWNPHGHEPAGVFTKPHFDMHFYMIDAAAVGEITPMRIDFVPRASNLPPAQYMPTGYAAPPGLPAMNTVPDMGLHWIDAAAGVGAPGYDFQQVLVAGSWDGAHTFLEPMMTHEWMLTKQSVDEAVAQPEKWAKSGYYPTTYTVRFDDSTSEYVIELGGMTLREAS
ncbi:DUF5602 domain-containing protein [Rhodococcus sp. NPDC003318]|uniref:DUF5602 domain-containing protein n=1 Tax=Rhodococcus sp. NPDC003318 TaxID=3364503 RepID=UPI003697425A